MIRVGLVGTGFAAKLRAETVIADLRSHLAGAASYASDRATEFCAALGIPAYPHWQAIIEDPTIDLVMVATANHTHRDVITAAFSAGKHVVVEYPLALTVPEAEALVALARQANRLLHIEHIEQLGGLHQTLQAHLARVGQPFYVRYSTLNPQRPAPTKWTYRADQFGFPLVGALSRIHRLTHLFGPVQRVACQNQYGGKVEPSQQYTTCLCTAQLSFAQGTLADVTYGKGEAIWTAVRRMEVHGDRAGLIFEGDQGTLITPEETIALPPVSRRGLFARDTQAVLDYLTTGTPLYVSPEASLAALRVADACRQAAESGQVISLTQGPEALPSQFPPRHP